MRSRYFVALFLFAIASRAAVRPGSKVLSAPPSQYARLESGQEWGQDNFGVTVAISQDQRTIVVGAPGWGSGGDIGSAYIFVEPPDGWRSTTRFTAKLTNGRNNPTDAFGAAVAISGDIIVVGAPGIPHENQPWGDAYVFVKPANGWKNTAQSAADLTAPQGFEGSFASSVAMDHNTIVVGGAEDLNEVGAAFVFLRPINGWSTVEPSAELKASDGSQGDDFGISIAIEAGMVAIGAIQRDGNQRPGEAYVFVEPAAGWTSGTETARLKPSDGKAFDKFGISASIDGDTVVVGAWEWDVGPGAAYVFVRPSTGWEDMTETAELTASDGQTSDSLGYAVAVRQGLIFIGAPYRSAGPAVYEFTKPKGGWETTSHYHAKLMPDGSFVGQSIALKGTTLVIGSAGTVFVAGR